MIVPVLILACVCALGESISPSKYLTAMRDIREASATLRQTLLSIDGNVPNLDDSRRDYAEIYNVINYAAIAQSGCFVPSYSEYYQRYLNVSAPQGISHPQGVVDEAKQLLENIYNHTKEGQDLLDRVCKNNVEHCDYDVDHVFTTHRDQVQLYLQVGEAAYELNALKKTFSSVAIQSAGHEYVIENGGQLEKVVVALSKVYRSLHSTPHGCS